MPVKILDIENQNVTLINNGALEENKVVGISVNRKSIKPYSNLFYFSNIWTDTGSTIKDINQKGFEVINYVIKGTVNQHFIDLNKTLTIGPGDVGYISSGYGIKMAEQYSKDSQLIRIWLDPNLRQSLGDKPFAKNYDSNDFTVRQIPGVTRKLILSSDSPLQILTPNVSLTDYKYTPGNKSIKIKSDHYLSVYLLKGELEVDNKFLKEDSFFIVKDEPEFEFFVSTHSRILALESPIRPDYKTYLELKSNQAE